MAENKFKKKSSKIERSAAKQLRDLTAAHLATQGKNTNEIAQEIGVDRNTVRRILNGNEVKNLLKTAQSRVFSLVDKALGTVEAAMDGNDVDMTNGLKASLSVLESVGVIKKNANISHTFPKPTIIRRIDGSEVVLGSKTDDDDQGAA